MKNELGATVLLLAVGACASTAPVEEVESFLETDDGVLLHYRMIGSEIGSGDDVLIVPGGSTVSADMERLAAGRTVVFYDARGRGRSDVVPHAKGLAFKRDVADLEIVRRWLSLDRFSLLGVDYYAGVAAHYAVLNPDVVERLVVASPMPARKTPYYDVYVRVFDSRIDPEKKKELAIMRRRLADRRDPKTWATKYAQMIFDGWVLDHRSLEDMRGNPFVPPNHDPERVTQQYFELLGSLGEWDWRPALRKIQCPALVVAGDSDPAPLESSREWAASMPNGRFQVVPRSGRLPWVERPSEFFPAVRSFLAEP